MQTARYFRDQAALCLEIALHLSDPHAAEDLRTTAAQHFTRATELEKEMELIRSPPTVPEK
jgi:hypothetical protein